MGARGRRKALGLLLFRTLSSLGYRYSQAHATGSFLGHHSGQFPWLSIFPEILKHSLLLLLFLTLVGRCPRAGIPRSSQTLLPLATDRVASSMLTHGPCVSARLSAAVLEASACVASFVFWRSPRS